MPCSKVRGVLDYSSHVLYVQSGLAYLDAAAEVVDEVALMKVAVGAGLVLLAELFLDTLMPTPTPAPILMARTKTVDAIRMIQALRDKRLAAGPSPLPPLKGAASFS